MIRKAIPPIVLPMIAPVLGCLVACDEDIIAVAAVVLLASLAEVVEAGGDMEDDSDFCDETKSAFTFGFEERNAAVRSSCRHPLAQASVLQQPMKVGLVSLHEYHWLPVGHSWS